MRYNKEVYNMPFMQRFMRFVTVLHRRPNAIARISGSAQYSNIIGSKRITSGGVGYDLAVDNNTITIYGTVIDGEYRSKTHNAFEKDEGFLVITKIVNEIMNSVSVI